MRAKGQTCCAVMGVSFSQDWGASTITDACCETRHCRQQQKSDILWMQSMMLLPDAGRHRCC